MSDKRSVFSVTVEIDEKHGSSQWTVVCERCGREIETGNSRQVVFRCDGYGALVAQNPDVARRLAEKIRADYRSPEPMVLDSSVSVDEVGRGMDESILAHLARCDRA